MSYQGCAVFKRCYFGEARYVTQPPEIENHIWEKNDTEHKGFFAHGASRGARTMLHVSPLFHEKHDTIDTKTRSDVLPRYVSAQSVANACSITPFSDVEDPSPVADYMNVLKLGAQKLSHLSICVPPSLLETFATSYIDYIRVPFFLVTILPSTRDEDVDSGMFPFTMNPDAFKKIITHPSLDTWFCTDLVMDGFPKMHHLPRGIDMQTMINTAREPADGRSLSVKTARWATMESKYAKITELRKGHPLGGRDVRVVCTSNLCLDSTGEGKIAMEEIRPELLVVPNTIPSNEEWMELVVRNAFVLCPYREVRDTSEIWEALALGSIPIVKKDAMRKLFTDLPVMQVTDWSDVTESNLHATLNKFRSQSFNYQKLKLRYWLDKFKP
jgi:hypothetical protein